MPPPPIKGKKKNQTNKYLPQGLVDLGVLHLPSDLLHPDEKEKKLSNEYSSGILLVHNLEK